MTSDGYRGRFAPSPTGPLHLGLARTALLGWLRARACGGDFVLRIEDLDGPRTVPGAADALRTDLAWLGLDWDEGPDVGGPFGPYAQSERTERYAAAVQTLEERGLCYRCSCSRKDVALASAPHGASELGPVYPGTCRNGPTQPERPQSWRLRVADPLPPFEDGLLGTVPAVAQGDFVLRRADGLFSYQLAVVVDDIAMQISEVVRGDDLAASTPWQLALYWALGAEPPAFVHVPLVYGPDGTRLAKRHGSVSVASFREAGVSPRKLVGALAASAGHVPEGTVTSAEALIDAFALSAVVRSEATLDPATLLED